MTERRKRGRPPLPADVKIARELERGLTKVNAILEAMVEGWEPPNPKGGRPPQRDYNQLLLEIADDADRHGIPLRTFVRDILRAANPFEEASEEWVLVLVRRINRQRAKSRPKGFAGAGESAGAVSEPDAPNQPRGNNSPASLLSAETKPKI
jgi:hypothetical protein